MSYKKIAKRIQKGDPLYLLFRNGKIATTGSSYPRVFYSKEHFDYHKKHYSGTFLEGDEIVKYVAEESIKEKAIDEFLQEIRRNCVDIGEFVDCPVPVISLYNAEAIAKKLIEEVFCIEIDKNE